MAETCPHYLTDQTNESDAQSSLLHRWSQRKREVRSAEQEKERSVSSSTPSPGNTEIQPAELPSVNDLRPESDFGGFLSPQVDEALRKVALRKLFHLADFNVVDGLNEYDEDFTLLEAMGDVVPHNLKRWQEQEREQANEPADNEGVAESPQPEAETSNPASNDAPLPTAAEPDRSEENCT